MSDSFSDKCITSSGYWPTEIQTPSFNMATLIILGSLYCLIDVHRYLRKTQERAGIHPIVPSPHELRLIQHVVLFPTELIKYQGIL